MAKKISERLIDRLIAEGIVKAKKEDVNFKRLYPSRNQRKAGGWGWCVTGEKNPLIDIGSCDSATDCVNADRLVLLPTGGEVVAEFDQAEERSD